MQTKYIVGIVLILIALSLIPLLLGKKAPGLKTQDVFDNLTPPSQEQSSQETPTPQTQTTVTPPTTVSTPPVVTPAPAPASVNVTISNFAFAPGTITVKKGTTVTWTNNDSMPHTVTSQGGTFGSGTLSQGTKFSFTFQTTGTYEYMCGFHPSMRGNIIVTQ